MISRVEEMVSRVEEIILRVEEMVWRIEETISRVAQSTSHIAKALRSGQRKQSRGQNGVGRRGGADSTPKQVHRHDCNGSARASNNRGNPPTPLQKGGDDRGRCDGEHRYYRRATIRWSAVEVTLHSLI
jgi:hypothetical protein